MWKNRRSVRYLRGILQVDLSKMMKNQVFVKISVLHSDRENSRKKVKNGSAVLKKAQKSNISDLPKVP